MATQMIIPGVFSTIQDLSATPQATATSRFGVVFTAPKGPTDELVIIGSEGALIREFGIPSASHIGMLSAIRYLRQGQFCMCVRVAEYDQTATINIPATAGSPTSLVVSGATTGSHFNRFKVIVADGTAQGYKLTFTDNDAVVEIWDNVLVGAANTGNARYIETLINAGSQHLVVSDVTTEATLKTGTYTLTGGDDGASVSAADYVGSITGNTRTGLKIFSDVESLFVDLLAVPGVSHRAVVSELLSLSLARQDCFSLIDGPDNLSVQQLVAWHNGAGGGGEDPLSALDSPLASMYSTWILDLDDHSGSELYLPPSGFVAGVIARMDAARGVQEAPAGLTNGMITNALGVRHTPDLGEQLLMFGDGSGNNINPIIARTAATGAGIGASGIHIGGEHTLQRTNTARSRISGSRIALTIRRRVWLALQVIKFESNLERTRTRAENLISPIVSEFLRNGGLTSADIVSDTSNNPPEQISKRILQIDIRLEITPKSEKISVPIFITPLGSSLTAV